jgi:hypothetical protein
MACFVRGAVWLAPGSCADSSILWRGVEQRQFVEDSGTVGFRVIRFVPPNFSGNTQQNSLFNSVMCARMLLLSTFILCCCLFPLHLSLTPALLHSTAPHFPAHLHPNPSLHSRCLAATSGLVQAGTMNVAVLQTGNETINVNVTLTRDGCASLQCVNSNAWCVTLPLPSRTPFSLPDHVLGCLTRVWHVCVARVSAV